MPHSHAVPHSHELMQQNVVLQNVVLRCGCMHVALRDTHKMVLVVHYLCQEDASLLQGSMGDDFR